MFVQNHSALWARTTKNTDVSTGPLAGPFARLLALLTVNDWMAIFFFKERKKERKNKIEKEEEAETKKEPEEERYQKNKKRKKKKDDKKEEVDWSW